MSSFKDLPSYPRLTFTQTAQRSENLASLQTDCGDLTDGILQVRGDDHLEDSGRVGDGALEVLEKHELVEGVVPLHQEDPAWQSSAQIFVSVVRIPPDTALCAALRVRHLRGHAVLLGDELLRYLGHGVH